MTSSWERISADEQEPVLLWVQKWEESERGWGCRPDGYTLHETPEDIGAFEKAIRGREMEGKPGGWIPDEYSRPCGRPYQAYIADAEVIERVRESDHGVWGPGRNDYPKAYVAGQDQEGWVHVPPAPKNPTSPTSWERISEDD